MTFWKRNPETGEVSRCDDALEWARWFERNREARSVRRTEVGPFVVSTAFLGIDHNFSGVGPPILWETMVFWHEPYRWAAEHDDLTNRYTSERGAIQGHELVVQWMKGRLC